MCKVVLVLVLVAQSCPTLCDPMDCSPLSMRFSRQGYWSGSPFPFPGDLPNPGIKPGSPALQADSLPTELQGRPVLKLKDIINHLFLSSGSLPKFYLKPNNSFIWI